MDRSGKDLLRQRIHPRMRNHDYCDGVYFVTACTQRMKHYFGYVCDGVMHSNILGEYLDSVLQSIEQKFHYCEIPLWVVMPNHFHAIIVIDGKKFEKAFKYVCRNSMALPIIMTSIKSAVTKFAYGVNIDFKWQRSYYDHIIRDAFKANEIDNYIRTNPQRWDKDCFNKQNM